MAIRFTRTKKVLKVATARASLRPTKYFSSLNMEPAAKPGILKTWLRTSAIHELRMGRLGTVRRFLKRYISTPTLALLTEVTRNMTTTMVKCIPAWKAILDSLLLSPTLRSEVGIESDYGYTRPYSDFILSKADLKNKNQQLSMNFAGYLARGSVHTAPNRFGDRAFFIYTIKGLPFTPIPRRCPTKNVTSYKHFPGLITRPLFSIHACQWS